MFYKIFVTSLPIFIVFIIFSLVFLYPAFSKEKKKKQMIENIKVGAKVITKGGIVAEIIEIKEKSFTAKSKTSVFILDKDGIDSLIEEN